MVRDKGLEAFRAYFGSSLWKMRGFKAARPLYKLKKWSGIRNLKLLETSLQAKKVVRDKESEAFRAYFGSSLWKMVRKKVVRDKGLEAFRSYFGSSLWKMLGLRDFKLLEPIFGHLCGRWSGLRLRDLSTS